MNGLAAARVLRAPALAERLARSAVEGLLGSLVRGKLSMELPDGARLTFGAGPGPSASLRVADWRLFSRLARHGDVGLGEAYTAGDFQTPDLTGLIRLFIDNEPYLARRYGRIAWLGRLANRAAHLLRRNTRRGSRSNIRAHYDLSNEMFSCFLDESMTYSCALFAGPEEGLAAAQRNKRLAVLRKARVGPGHHVLEIGSGWGSFAIEAARETGCRVTGITLSKEQLSFARERARQAGVADRVRFELMDYRDVRERFDRVVSIEMIEAVGHENLGAYFGAIDRALKEGGLAVIQAITIPDHRYDAYRKGCDWIQKHIFPGAVVPSLTAICEAMTRGSRLMIEHAENIGVHYARTLREWRRSFLAAGGRLKGLGFRDDFLRAWEYYFCYCEAGFAARELGDLQLVLTRSNNPSLPPAEKPWAL